MHRLKLYIEHTPVTVGVTLKKHAPASWTIVLGDTEIGTLERHDVQKTYPKYGRWASHRSTKHSRTVTTYTITVGGERYSFERRHVAIEQAVKQAIHDLGLTLDTMKHLIVQ